MENKGGNAKICARALAVNLYCSSLKKDGVRVCVREKDRVCVCVCVCVRERERWKERVKEGGR